jgi:hypothetical protein
MNSDTPPPVPGEPTGGSASGENPDEPKKKPRRHILGLPLGYKFDPNAKPTMEDLYGIPARFGDDEPLRPGQGRTESDKLSAGN